MLRGLSHLKQKQIPSDKSVLPGHYLKGVEMDYGKIIRSISNTMRKAGSPLSEDQEACLAGSMAIYLDKAYETGRILTCVYCGYEYPQETPASGDQVLTDHIKICKKHPLRAAEKKITTLRNALSMLVGSDDPEQLKEMEVTLRLMHIPAEDKVATIDAIHALLNT